MSSTTPSTYASTVGVNALARWFIEHLGLTPKDFGRFRDAALYRDAIGLDGKGIFIIRVLTRNAGSKMQFEPVNLRLAQHPLYIRQEIDPTDEGKSYLYFFFQMPESMWREIRKWVVDLDLAFEANDTLLVDNRDVKTKFADAEAKLNNRSNE